MVIYIFFNIIIFWITSTIKKEKEGYSCLLVFHCPYKYSVSVYECICMKNCKSLWIKSSAKCPKCKFGVNINIAVYVCFWLVLLHT